MLISLGRGIFSSFGLLSARTARCRNHGRVLRTQVSRDSPYIDHCSAENHHTCRPRISPHRHLAAVPAEGVNHAANGTLYRCSFIQNFSSALGNLFSLSGYPQIIITEAQHPQVLLFQRLRRTARGKGAAATSGERSRAVTATVTA